MQKTKKETCFVPPLAAANIAEGLTVIDGFPFPHCRFVLDQSIELDKSIEVYEHWPLVMGCIENDAGEARRALIAISEERNRAKRALYHAIGRPCLAATILSLSF